MKLIKSPNKIINTDSIKAVFLAGSIEMGIADDWQNRVCNSLKDKNVLILNPRRDKWDNSWEQSIDNELFREQVEWELEGIIEKCDVVFFNFDINTKSPVTLLELGLVLASNKKAVVCCPEGYWRKGNVDVTCKKFGVHVFENIELAVEQLISVLGL